VNRISSAIATQCLFSQSSSIPKSLEGQNLKHVLAESSATVKDAALSQFPRRHERRDFMGYALRTHRFRYVEWQSRNSGEIEACERYDHTHDLEIHGAGEIETSSLTKPL